MVRKPYLIQTGTINHINKTSVTKKLAETVNFSYMGSAEFEFGALPNSLRTFRDVMCELDVCYGIINDEGSPLRVYHHFTNDEYQEYVKYIHDLRDDKIILKEVIYFAKKYEKPIFKKRENLWWDIKNNVLFSFHKTFMKNIIASAIQNSLLHMNEQKS